jgi:hypothetical protein
MNNFVYFDEITQSLSKSVARGDASLKAVPGLVRLIIGKKMWKRRISTMTGHLVEFDSFEHFVTSPPPEGLGSSVETLICLCAYDHKTIQLIEKTVGKTDSKFHPPKNRRTHMERFNLTDLPRTASKLKKHLSASELVQLINELQSDS